MIGLPNSDVEWNIKVKLLLVCVRSDDNDTAPHRSVYPV